MTQTPVVLDPDLRQHGLQLPATARALVLIAHPDAASRDHPGHGFAADVLRANGFGTLAFCLHTPEEMAGGTPAPGMVQIKLRLRMLFDWLGRQPALGTRPLALVGVGDAAAGCIAAAARDNLSGLHTLVLLDAQPDQVAHHLSRLYVPTLSVLGRCSAGRLARHRSALREMPGGHRLQLLNRTTRPQPAPGALEAFACAALDWLEHSLLPKTPRSGRLPDEPTAGSHSRQEA